MCRMALDLFFSCRKDRQGMQNFPVPKAIVADGLFSFLSALCRDLPVFWRHYFFRDDRGAGAY